MKKNRIMVISGLAVVAAVFSVWWNSHKTNTYVSESDSNNVVEVSPIGPAFNADSAYLYARRQCEFGYRSMNTVEHDKCGEWIVRKFEQLGCVVTTQKMDVEGYDGTKLHAMNIIARYNPKAKTRIMLCAHWDTRPWADNDPDSANWHKPVMGANDGASGVAVMMEIARLLHQDGKLSIGVDFVCFDAEDWGVPQWSDNQDSGDSWALGAQYFAHHLPRGIEPQFGVLLDMVGGKAARFYREGMSIKYAPDVVDRIWNAATRAGYDTYFPYAEGGMITDDHIPMNEIANIPTADVICYYPECPQSSFGPTWHTIHDTMENIDPLTLKAVGQTMVQMLYECNKEFEGNEL